MSVRRRYEGALKRFPPSTELGQLIQRDREGSYTLLEHYVALTGDAALLQGSEHFRRGD